MKRLALIGTSAIALMVTGCRVGPTYVRPTVPAPPAFKEQPPSTFTEGWRTAQPADTFVKGDWWTMFGDAQLNALESQVDAANQTLRAADANYRAAAADVAFYRASRAPTVGVAPFAGTTRESSNQPYFNQQSALAGANGVGSLSLPFSLNYEVDLWGRVRRSIQQAGDQAQASAADRENIRLSLHAELASDYLDLRASDAQKRLLHDTVGAYQHALQLTQDRYDGGAAPLSDVSQARTQLQSALVQEADVDVQRKQLEHAIAVLIGKAPADLTLPRTPVTVDPPALPNVPGMVPSQLLERRPDIASAERQMAASNEQIGIAEAAFYPTLSLSATAGFVGSSAVNLFSWPSRFFAVGPTLSQTLYDHGRRRSLTDVARAQYDSTVADYQQTTLDAFRQVEDNLAALQQLEMEAQRQTEATAAAQQSLDLFNIRYEGGVDTYLQVVTSQTALLQNQRNDIDIERRRLDDTVLLIKALGGGWNQAQLPKP